MHPLLLMVTHEEQRAVSHISQVVAQYCTEYSNIYSWSFGPGWERVWNASDRPLTKEEEAAIKASADVNPVKAFPLMKAEVSPGSVFILKDFPHFLNGSNGFLIGRMMRDLVAAYSDVPEKMAPSVIIMLDSESELPARLEKLVHVIDLELPDRDLLYRTVSPLVDQHIEQNGTPTVNGQVDRDGELTKASVAEAALGLTLVEAESAVNFSLASTGGFDTKVIGGEKQSIIRKSGVLEYYAADTDLSNVGGMGNLKRWLEMRQKSFSKEAREYGLPVPRGILTVGPPGTGKSLVARSISRTWNMPVLRMDVGALFGSLVGQSEANMRKALRTAEAVAPCCLWVN